MIEWVGYIIGLVVAGSVVFFLRSLVLLVHARWRPGVSNAAGGFACLLLGTLLLFLMAFVFARSEPHADGRRLAAIFIELSYSAIWTALLGVPAGAVAVMVTYRRIA